MERRNVNLDPLYCVVDLLSRFEDLPKEYDDHKLLGDMSGKRECHIKPNWILIYSISDDDLVLYLCRTGRHQDVLKKYK